MIKLIHKIWHDYASRSLLLQWLFVHEPFLTVYMALALAWKKHQVRQIYKNPTKVMREAVKYFARPDIKERVKKVAATLADEESRKTYLGMVEFRQTADVKFLRYHGWRTQYFGVDCVKFPQNGDGECLIDCGAFIGDTALRFAKMHPPPKFRQIVCFEPDIKIFGLLKRVTNKLPNVRCINGGVSDKDCEIGFTATGQGTSRISEDAETKIKLYRIDSFLDELPKVTFIKMDIEGAELSALKGAYETIKRDMPRLAICIYHSNADMLEIAEWMRENFPEYRLYVRHHCVNGAETVLYARV